MSKEQEALSKIEFKKRTWKSDFMREYEIMMVIMVNINSYQGKKQQFWCDVMDLYNAKYRKTKS